MFLSMEAAPQLQLAEPVFLSKKCLSDFPLGSCLKTVCLLFSGSNITITLHCLQSNNETYTSVLTRKLAESFPKGETILKKLQDL